MERARLDRSLFRRRQRAIRNRGTLPYDWYCSAFSHLSSLGLMPQPLSDGMLSFVESQTSSFAVEDSTSR
jgi:hypothetical protein